MTGYHDLQFLNVELISQLFHSPRSLSSRGSLDLFFLTNGNVICIPEVIDISPSNLDSRECYIQPGILHDVFRIYVKQAE